MIENKLPISDKAVERFWAKAQKRDQCLIWTANLSPKGYGVFSTPRKTYRAHRLSYILHFGPIPEGLCVLHRCDTPACIEPSHLFLGTVAENNADMALKGRSRGPLKNRPKQYPLTLWELLAVIAKKYNISRVELYRMKTGK